MTNYIRHCQSNPLRKCDRKPQCGLDCEFDAAEVTKPPGDPADWTNDPPEFHWSLVAWAILLMAGAFGIVGLVL